MSTSENIRRNQTGEQFHPMPTETKATSLPHNPLHQVATDAVTNLV